MLCRGPQTARRGSRRRMRLPTCDVARARAMYAYQYVLRSAEYPLPEANHSTRLPTNCGSNRLNLPLSMSCINAADSQPESETHASSDTHMHASDQQKRYKQKLLWQSSDRSWNRAEIQRPVDIRLHVREPTLRPLPSMTCSTVAHIACPH